MVFVFDCGHAKVTPGKRSFDGQLKEYEYNRIIGKRVAEELDKLHIKYYFTYPLDRTDDLSLSQRAAKANEVARKYGAGSTLLVSIHSNAFGNGSEWYDDIVGWSVYTSKGNTASDKYAEIFYDKADRLLKPEGIKIRRDMSDGDSDYEENFYVLKHTICPAILIEELFYTSHKDLAFMQSEKGKELLANTIIEAIKEIEHIAT